MREHHPSSLASVELEANRLYPVGCQNLEGQAATYPCYEAKIIFPYSSRVSDLFLIRLRTSPSGPLSTQKPSR